MDGVSAPKIDRAAAARRREAEQQRYEESARRREAIRDGYPAGAPLMCREIIGRDTVKLFNWHDWCRQENERARRDRARKNH